MNENVYQPPASELAPPPHHSLPGSYQPQLFAVRLIALGLGAHALLSLGMLAIHLWTVSLMNQVSIGIVSESALNSRDVFATGCESLRKLCYWGTGIVTFVFLHRANHNARALGAEGMQFTPGWTVGWFFVPIANWFKPYAAVKEIWAASGYGDNAFEQSPVLPLWWTCWLIMSIGNRFAGLLFSANNPSSLATASMIHAVLVIITIAGAYFAYQVFSGIHERQEGRAAELSA